jgi:hypothetical protein
MILIFYNKYICIQSVPQEAENIENGVTLEQVTKIFISVVELFSHILGITLL